MKKMLLDYGIAIIYSITVLPFCLIGLWTAGTVWGEKIEPWLRKKLRISETEGD